MGECCILSQYSKSQEKVVEEELLPEFHNILEQYHNIFEEPKALPPQRPKDHRIPLQPRAIPVNLRPYRHSHEQKEEIENKSKKC